MITQIFHSYYSGFTIFPPLILQKDLKKTKLELKNNNKKTAVPKYSRWQRKQALKKEITQLAVGMKQIITVGHVGCS